MINKVLQCDICGSQYTSGNGYAIEITRLKNFKHDATIKYNHLCGGCCEYVYNLIEIIQNGGTFAHADKEKL